MITGSAFGEDYPQRAAQKSQSLTRGIPQSITSVLVRNAGNARSTKTALLASLCGSCQTSETVTVAKTHVEGAGWTLDIEADGTQGIYQIKDAEAYSSRLAMPSTSRLSKGALESAGRAFIGSKLANVIMLGQNEQLVALTAAYRFEGGQDVRTKAMAPEMVVANRIVFGRTIGGIPVVGGGSIVVVTFANDGNVESFFYDWPSYSASSTQQTAIAPSKIVGRVQQAISARSLQVKASTALPISMSSYPISIAPQVQIQDLECGYFDPGLNRRDSKSVVQSGCTYHVVENFSDGAGTSRSAYGGAVPASAQILADTSWPEVVFLTGGASNKVQTPATAPTK